MPLHLIKLCVGCDTVEELIEWRKQTQRPGEPWVLRTRQTPRRATELVDGGSVYRVYKGFILSRQAILAIDTVGVGPAAHCAVTLSEDLILTAPTPRRAFQGWRYLTMADAPPDLGPIGGDQAMPADLVRTLRQIGAW